MTRRDVPRLQNRDVRSSLEFLSTNFVIGLRNGHKLYSQGSRMGGGPLEWEGDLKNGMGNTLEWEGDPLEWEGETLEWDGGDPRMGP